MAPFASYYLGFVLRPRRTADALMQDPRRLRLGSTAVALTATLYTFVYVFLIFGGGRPYKPWLAIPPEVYYRYNVFLLAPSMFMSWILAAGVAQLLARFFGGRGAFEDVLAALGFGLAIANWWTLLHDLVTSFLGAIHVMDQRQYEVALNSPTPERALLWVLMALYLVWFVLLFSKGIGAAQRLRPGAAALLGALAFATYQGVFLIFNR